MIKEYKFIEVKQNNIIFYLVSIDSKTLSKICRTSMHNLEAFPNHDVYQRTLKFKRVKQISEFVQRNRGIMPPAIVLNSLKPIVIENEKIIINDECDQFFVIDGQHRIAGVNEAKKEDFYFPVVLMNNVDLPFQDELFVSINNEQKRVNPTIRFRMKANQYAITPEKAVLNIALFLNNDTESPFYGLLIMDDLPYRKKTAMLSLSAFSQILLSYTYDESEYYRIKDILLENDCQNRVNHVLGDIYIDKEKYFLWTFYENDKFDVVGKILYNYFSVLKKVFQLSWGNKLFITTKTTGYNSFMLLFKDIFFHCFESDRNFSFSYMFDLLHPLKKFDEKMTQTNYGLGKASSLALYRQLYSTVFEERDASFDYNNLSKLLDDSEE